jgi:hypothetical protein
MQHIGRSLGNLLVTLIAAVAVYGCGDTEPDLEFRPLYNDSPLRLSIPLSELIFEWAPVVGDGEAVPETIYTIKQLPASIDGLPVILTSEIQQTALELELDISSYGPEVEAIVFDFVVSATYSLPDSDNNDVSTAITSEISFLPRFIVAARVLQFDWNPVDGASGYLLTQTGGRLDVLDGRQQAFTSDELFLRTEIPVHLFDWQDSLFMLEACIGGTITGVACVGDDDAGFVTVGLQDTAFASSAFIGTYADPDMRTKISQQLAFGWSIALSEDGALLAVGEIGDGTVPVDQRVCPEDDAECDVAALQVSATNAGAVQIFDLLTNQIDYIKSPNVDPFDLFGSAVALSADGLTLAVAAMTEGSDATDIATDVDSSQNNDASNSGAVYIYSRTNGSWELESYIKASQSTTDYLFGLGMALSSDGNTLAVSAMGDDSDPQTSAGAVYVYTREAGVWSESAFLKAGVANGTADFGHTLAMSGDGMHLAVGSLGPAISSDVSPLDVCTATAGAVYVFARELDAWTETGLITASNKAGGDCFGRSLAFDQLGSLLVVGAPFEDQMASGVTPIGSGYKSPISGDNAGVGAAYLFERSGSGSASSWASKRRYFKPSNPNEIGAFGTAVSISSDGAYIAAGAVREGSSGSGINGNQFAESNANAGAAYVFAANGSSDAWQQVAFVKPPVPTRNQFFGGPIQFAKSGELLAVGGVGFRRDGRLTGFPGFVYLY